MDDYLRENDITFPVCVDTAGTIASFEIDSYPDYAVVDRQGILRIVDLANAEVERAVEHFLAQDDHLSAAVEAALPDEGVFERVVLDVLQGDEVIGELELGASRKPMGDQRILAFADTFRMDLAGGERRMAMSFAGALELGPRLRPLHLTMTDDDGTRHEAEVADEGRRWLASFGEDEAPVELPPGTLVDFALFHLAPGLPEEEGYAFVAPWFEMEDGRVRAPHRVANVGREELEQHGETVKAWRWVVEAPGDAPAPSTRLELWTAEGELVRAAFDGKTLVRRAE